MGKVRSWEDIPGWFNYQDFYSDRVRTLDDYAVIVEIGCWFGRSTAYLAEEIRKSGKAIEFYAVDVWTGSKNGMDAEWHKGPLEENGGDLFPAFWENMKVLGLDGIVKPLQMTSKQASGHFTEKSVDFVYIDGEHTFEGVSGDIACWRPKVKSGGVIAGHDYEGACWPDVIRAVDAVFPSVGLDLQTWWTTL